MYGLTFPKIKPFLFGCVGAGIAGCVASLMGLAAQGTGASMIPGILLYLQEGFMKYILVITISIVSSFLLTWIFYKEEK